MQGRDRAWTVSLCKIQGGEEGGKGLDLGHSNGLDREAG